MEGDEAGTSKNEEKKILTRFNRICVFCGSRAGYSSSFTDAALSLGNQLVILINFILVIYIIYSSLNFLTPISMK